MARDFLGSHGEYTSSLDENFIKKSIRIDKQKKRNKYLLIGFVFISLIGVILFVLDLKRVANLESEKSKNISNHLTKIFYRFFYYANTSSNLKKTNRQNYTIYTKESKKNKKTIIYFKNYDTISFNKIKFLKLIIEECKKSQSKEVTSIAYLAYLELAQFYLKEQKYQKTITSYRNAIDIGFKNGRGVVIQTENAFSNENDLNKITVLEKNQIYQNIGTVYILLKKYHKAKKSYFQAININKNRSKAYTKLFELQLTQNQPFNQKLEKKYKELFQNKKETFIYYEMLKILQNITHNKKVNLEQWKQKYYDVEMGWDFEMLDEWIDGFDEGEVKERLREAIGVFKGHR